ncbi:hypothetical protein TYRP_015495 [Tyrophagus putrescentiae]|nr:hypothetical protein TYRP_015495 [Tyrophagus putrescentiae]
MACSALPSASSCLARAVFRVLHRVVRLPLNVQPQKVTGEEAQGDHALRVGRLKEKDGVDHLLRRDDEVDDAKVVAEAVADKDDAVVDEEAQLLVGGLQGGEVL